MFLCPSPWQCSGECATKYGTAARAYCRLGVAIWWMKLRFTPGETTALLNARKSAGREPKQCLNCHSGVDRLNPYRLCLSYPILFDSGYRITEDREISSLGWNGTAAATSLFNSNTVYKETRRPSVYTVVYVVRTVCCCCCCWRRWWRDLRWRRWLDVSDDVVVVVVRSKSTTRRKSNGRRCDVESEEVPAARGRTSARAKFVLRNCRQRRARAPRCRVQCRPFSLRPRRLKPTYQAGLCTDRYSV